MGSLDVERNLLTVGTPRKNGSWRRFRSKREEVNPRPEIANRDVSKVFITLRPAIAGECQAVTLRGQCYRVRLVPDRMLQSAGRHLQDNN
jgi:hypothetical protein